MFVFIIAIENNNKIFYANTRTPLLQNITFTFTKNIILAMAILSHKGESTVSIYVNLSIKKCIKKIVEQVDCSVSVRPSVHNRYHSSFRGTSVKNSKFSQKIRHKSQSTQRQRYVCLRAHT